MLILFVLSCGVEDSKEVKRREMPRARVPKSSPLSCYKAASLTMLISAALTGIVQMGWFITNNADVPFVVLPVFASCVVTADFGKREDKIPQ